MSDLQSITNNQTNNTTNVKADKVVIIKNDGGYFNNGGFLTAFSEPLLEIAQNRELTKLDLRFMVLILSYMGDTGMMISANRQRLLRVEVYCRELGEPKTSKGNISKSFQKLEQMGYFKRDKGRKELEIMINPALAYNGKTREFNRHWNETAIDFGNTPRKLKEDGQEDGQQEWDSHLIDDIKKKRTMKQMNIDGGIDDVEIE